MSKDNGEDKEKLICKSCKGNLFEEVKCFTLQKGKETGQEGTIIPDKVYMTLRCMNCGELAMEPMQIGRVKKPSEIITPNEMRHARQSPFGKMNM